jgi:hypothetical protein
MRYILIISLSLALLACSTISFAFNCSHIEFGSLFSEIDDGNFIPYKKENNITYYNYVGQCRLPAHENSNPAVSYAFIDNRIYARIIRAFDRNKETVLASMTAKAGPPKKIYEEGDWTVYVWNFEKDVKSKLKFNNRTNESRSACYSEPLRKLLDLKTNEDPSEPSTK